MVLPRVLWVQVCPNGNIVGVIISRSTSAVPISRAQDEAKPGTGVIKLSPTDPCLVIGVGTKFLTELGPRKKIMLPKSVGAVLAEVDEIISDIEVRVKREFSGDKGKGTAKILQKLAVLEAEGEKGLAFKVLPHINQEAIYRHVYQQLKEGGCIGIFPEGMIWNSPLPPYHNN